MGLYELPQGIWHGCYQGVVAQHKRVQLSPQLFALALLREPEGKQRVDFWISAHALVGQADQTISQIAH